MSLTPDMIELITSAMRAKRAELQHAPLDRIYGELFEAGAIALMVPESNNDPVLNFIAGNDTSELARCQASEAYMSGALSRELELHEETRKELETVRANCAATSNSYLARALAAEEKLAALGDTHVMVPREPTADMIAAAFPCSANEEFTHADKVLGAAVCLKLGGGANVGLFEGEAVKQAAFLARDYRLMIAARPASQE